MNHVTLTGVIVHLWSYDGQLYARVMHRDPQGQSGYYSLNFPATPLPVSETANGQYQQRRVQFEAQQRDRLAVGQVLLVTGQLQHRDEHVTLREFAARCSEFAALTEAQQTALTDLSTALGAANRAHVEVLVQEVAYL